MLKNVSLPHVVVSVQFNLFVRARSCCQRRGDVQSQTQRWKIIPRSALVNNVALPCSVIENHSEIAFVHLPYMKHIFS